MNQGPGTFPDMGPGPMHGGPGPMHGGPGPVHGGIGPMQGGPGPMMHQQAGMGGGGAPWLHQQGAPSAEKWIRFNVPSRKHVGMHHAMGMPQVDQGGSSSSSSRVLHPSCSRSPACSPCSSNSRGRCRAMSGCAAFHP